ARAWPCARPRRDALARRRAGGDRRRPTLAGGGPRPSRAGALGGRPCRARRRPRPRECARGDRRHSPVGGGRQLEPGDRAGNQGPRSRSRVRGGGSMSPRLYGVYGGRFVPETLVPALDELEAGWAEAKDDPTFHAELDRLRREYGGRPTPLTRA